MNFKDFIKDKGLFFPPQIIQFYVYNISQRNKSLGS